MLTQTKSISRVFRSYIYCLPLVTRTLDNSKLSPTPTNFHFPLSNFVYNFTLDNSNNVFQDVTNKYQKFFSDRCRYQNFQFLVSACIWLNNFAFLYQYLLVPVSPWPKVLFIYKSQVDPLFQIQVRFGKNCAQGLGDSRYLGAQDRGHSFSNTDWPRLVNKILIFF